MTKRVIGLGAAVLAMLFVGQAARADLSDRDNHLVIKAKLESDAQLDLAGMAWDHTRHKEVKEVSGHVVEDQKKMNEELHEICRHHDVHLTNDDTISAEEMHHRLAHLDGHDFDVAFVDDEVKRHERMFDLWKDMSESADSHEIRDWAHDHLGVIKFHLEKFKELQAKLEH
jgi:predicted outer membrane protein